MKEDLSLLVHDVKDFVIDLLYDLDYLNKVIIVAIISAFFFVFGVLS